MAKTTIPSDITRDDIERAVDHVLEHGPAPFSAATSYVLAHPKGECPPKAVIGFAASRAMGRQLQPSEFSSGVAPGQAIGRLRDLGYEVRLQDEVSTDFASIMSEMERRDRLWSEAMSRIDDPHNVPSSIWRDLKIYNTARGIFRDKKNTAHLTPDGHGVALSVMHNGSSYADDLSSEALVYHYPTGVVEGANAGDIAAMKNAARLELPLFAIVVSDPSNERMTIKRAWVTEWDDSQAAFRLMFGDMPPDGRPNVDQTDFKPMTTRTRVERKTNRTNRSATFHFDVMARYGARCAVCGIAVKQMIDAAHIIPVSSDGSDDPRNGLPLCASHHRAFDAFLFTVDPETLCLTARESGPSVSELGIAHTDLLHLNAQPALEAIQWRWDSDGW